MPRISSSNPLAQALDKRIRAAIDETMEEALRGSIRRIIQEELAAALGTAAAPPAIGTRRAGRPPGRRVQAGRKARGGAAAAEGSKVCEVAGCKRPYRSQGYCAAHYQAARKYDWPLPAPKGFTPPPRPARGRPPKEAAARSE
ncbi:hypothetical protein [Vulgatibacter sp.]|uniref:hypothetical protein n=1 Tax=Vulgatibacter sp. TaxID=1971226 RepID=UPI0035690830